MAYQQPPPPPPHPGSGVPPQNQQKQPAEAVPLADLNFYELLQVDRDAHSTIIRYAYRFLAAMYHPDNAESGNAEKFRIISEAWRTLSDDAKRAAYDMSLGAKEQAKKAAAKPTEAKPEFGRQSLPNVPKTNLTWNEMELRLGILQVLLAARKQKPGTGGGASGKVLMDCLNIDNVIEVEFALWYLREKGYIQMGERSFVITALGVDYLTEQLSRTEVLGGPSAMEKKTGSVVGTAGLPAIKT
jgi:hypothetical protein